MTAAIIAGLAIILYGLSLLMIQSLSSSWRICPTDPDDGPFKPLTDFLHSHFNLDSHFNPAIAKPTTSPAPKALSSQPPVSNQALLELMARNPQPDQTQAFAAIDKLADTISGSQKYRLKEQFAQLYKIQKNSCEIGVFFFSHRNATYTVATAAALLSVASLAFISKEDWKGTNNLFITIGLSSGMILFSTWTFSQLYGQGVNYENQKTKVALATDIINRLASAAANHLNASLVKNSDTNGTMKTITVDLNNPKDLTALMDALDDQLRVLTNLDFTGDYSFAEQSAKRFGDMLNGSIKTLAPLPAQGPALR